MRMKIVIRTFGHPLALRVAFFTTHLSLLYVVENLLLITTFSTATSFPAATLFIVATTFIAGGKQLVAATTLSHRNYVNKHIIRYQHRAL